MRLPMTLALVPLVLLICPDPSAAQGGASASISSAPTIIVALVLALMAAALLLVGIVICHFAWFRRTAFARQRMQQQQQLQPRPQPSTVPKGTTVVDAPLPSRQLTPQPRKPEKKQPNPRMSSIADPLYIAADLQEPDVEVVKVPTVSSQQQRLPAMEMRHTGSQFLEFLSRKWNMEQHQHRPQQPQPPSPIPPPQVAARMTTFKPPTSAVASPEQIRPQWPQLADEFFDVCEQDVGQYDNMAPSSAVRGGREADRYEVAMELRDTRRSRTSTPGLGGRDSEPENDEQQQQQQQQQQQAADGTDRYIEWFEDVSQAI